MSNFNVKLILIFSLCCCDIFFMTRTRLRLNFGMLLSCVCAMKQVFENQ